MSLSSSSPEPKRGIGKELMRRLPLFAGLSEEDFEQLHATAQLRSFEPGLTVIREGDPGDELFILVDGEVEITKRDGAREVVLATGSNGDVFGERSLLENTPRSATVRTLRHSDFLVISRGAFQTLLSCSPAAPATVLRTLVSRLRSNESLLMQQEKLAGLGTMAAGLAHELNNPAAAIQRSAAHLREALEEWEDATTAFAALELSGEQKRELLALRSRVGTSSRAAGAPNTLVIQDEQSDVQQWLEQHGVELAWERAAALASAGWDREALQTLAAKFRPAELPVIARWIAAGPAAFELLDELRTSTAAISEVVASVRQYSFLDRAPVQEVDIHESLESTLVMLRHRLRAGVEVLRDFAPGLPRVEAYGSELNQVWTNLIANAIDAMEGHGKLVLRTRWQAEHVAVEIIDDGPGIPAEVRPRIFEPFFTTKPVGVGTGLGLHLVHNLVVHRHKGQIRVDSQPGETRFEVRLPLRLARPEGGGEPARRRQTRDGRRSSV